MPYPKRLIEVDLPIRRISAHSSREKSIRHGHISTLHIWWARRPLAACRAVICASLWPDPADENCSPSFKKAVAQNLSAFATAVASSNVLANDHCSPEAFKRWNKVAAKPLDQKNALELREALLEFIAEFANWDNSSTAEYIETASAITQAAHTALGGTPGTRPLVVDPFTGGGSIPMEALRIGADAFASDLNPVPVLLNKVMLEHVPRYGKKLSDGIRKWGESLKADAEKELAGLYPPDSDGAIPTAYLWARTIRCEGPGCGATIPLFRGPVLAQKGKLTTRIELLCDKKTKRIEIDIRKDSSKNMGPSVLRRSAATCPLCGYTTPAANVRGQFKGRQGGAADAQLLAVVTMDPKTGARGYRPSKESDFKATRLAVVELDRIRKAHPEEIPTEPLPYLRSIFNIHLLDVTEWAHLFTPRQLLSLIKLARLIRELPAALKKEGVDADLSRAIVTCLALAVDKVAAQFSSLSWWQPKGEFVVGTFGRQALGIVWDFAEIRPVKGASGDLDGAIDWIVRVIESTKLDAGGQATVERASATKHPLPNDSASAVVTDPPYYDAVPYADLSDYFFVWLKRMLSKVEPSLFSEELTPKRGEIVQLAERNIAYAYKTKEYFEEGMMGALLESKRITIPGGVAVVVFAHKTTQGWESMLSSIVKAGWVVTASWPIDTERAVRMRATDSAALASSVHLVCRPREDSRLSGEVGDWRDILEELPRRIHEWMPRLADEGVVGADAIFACLGPALEIYSRYSRVEKASGDVVTLRDYLEQVWAAVAKEAMTMVFRGADAAGLEPDARLTAMWLWTLSAGEEANGETRNESEGEVDEEETSSRKAKPGGFTLEYDAARKISQGLGADLATMTSLVEISGDRARLLPVSERAVYLFGKDRAERTQKELASAERSQIDLFKNSQTGHSAQVETEKKTVRLGLTVLDRVHQSMLLFSDGRSEALRRFIVDDGIGKDQRFWSLAQALSALYPSGTVEKRWVDGVLARKKGLGF